jgi:hypothetical protein
VILVPFLWCSLPFISIFWEFIHQLVDYIESFIPPKGIRPSKPPIELPDILDIQIYTPCLFLCNHLFLRDNLSARPLLNIVSFDSKPSAAGNKLQSNIGLL